MKCPNCHEEIMQTNPTLCPYCGSKIVISEKDAAELEKTCALEEIEQLEKAGEYEDAALKYEELDMNDEAEECRKNIGKVEIVSMKCPHCGASQPLTSKSNKITCKRCGKDFGIPKNVLDLL